MSINQGALREHIERIESLIGEKQEASDLIREAYGAAKGDGYDTKVMRQVIARRKKAADDIAEEEALIEMYERAMRGDGQ